MARHKRIMEFLRALSVLLWGVVGLLSFVSTTGYAQQKKQQGEVESKLIILQKQDSLEACVYTYLDEFLKNPSYDNLSVIDAFEQDIWRKPKTKAEVLALTIFYSNVAYYKLEYSLVEEAVEAYEMAWKYYKPYNFSNYDIIEYCLKPLGNAYSMLGDYSSAESIIKSYLLRAGAMGKGEHQVSALINLSIVYHDTGRHEEAIDVLSRALALGEFEGKKRGLVYSSLAKNYYKIKEIGKAVTAAEQALGIFEKQEAGSQLINAYSTLSLINLSTGDTTASLNLLVHAEKLAVSTKIKPRDRAKINVQLANLLGVTRSPDRAISHYQKALTLLINGYEGAAILPQQEELYAENTLKEAFDGMAGIFVRQNRLKLAIVCYELSFKVEELLKETYNYREAKYLQQGENRNRAEKVIDLLYNLSLSNPHHGYAEEAFAIAERTKSLALKDELYSRNVWSQLANDSLSQIRISLNKQKALVENALVREQQKGNEADMVVLKQLIDEKNELTLEWKDLEQSIGFGQMSNDFEKEAIDSLQQTLKADEVTLIEYFYGNNALYTFVLDGGRVKLFRNIQIDSVRDLVRKYGQLFTDEVKINAAPELFAGLSQNLYELLLPVSVDSTLLIVPDGLLNFIPFEALLAEAPTSTNYAAWPWLVKEAPVFYQYSAALYNVQRSVEVFNSRKVLGFFPMFQNTNRYLTYSENEADQIKKHFEGEFLTNEQAGKQAFLNRAANYPIIHLSTHAKAGGIHEPPSISFADSALYLPEIYGLNLQTELLVLGACETGIGKLYKGEGPLSLANGFLHAGVKNIMLSLWKVNDFTTSKLMTHFYRHYEEETRVHLSLYKAKLDYLADEQISLDKKSPYYWASFVYYGDNIEKKDKEISVWYVIGAMVLMVLAGGLLYWLRGRNKNLKLKVN